MWHYLHQYRKLANAGLVKHLTCPDDGFILTPVFNSEDFSDEPWLYCAGCNGMTKPGLELIQQVKAVVNEWSA